MLHWKVTQVQKDQKEGPQEGCTLSFTYYDFVDVLPTTAEQIELERIGLGGYFFC